MNKNGKTMIRKSVLLIPSFLLIFLFLTGCDTPSKPGDIKDNPVDTTGTAFLPPGTVLLSGQINGSVIKSSSVTFEWRGSADVIAFSYQFNGGEWSAWSSDTKITFDYLDEGQYAFAVKAKHKNGTSIEKEFPSINFTVDAVQGPSVMFLPRKMTVNAGSTFRYEIKAEEVTGLFAAKLTVQYPPQVIRVDSIVKGSFTTINGSDVLLFQTNDPTAGTQKIEFVRVGTSSRGVTGSGSVASLYCTALKAGDADFVFNKNETVYRDTVNGPITIKEFVAGKVVVK